MRRFWKWGTLLIALLICLFWMILPPKHFPVDTTFHIREGMSMRTIALSLHESHMVRSATLFQLITKITGQAENLQAGDYIFDDAVWTPEIMHRIVTGQHGDVFIHLTIPEGSSLQDIADITRAHIPDFNSDYFIEQAIPYNGYLFPDTYFIFPSITEDELITLMHDEFSEHLIEIIPEGLVEVTPEELREKIIMASILEREANGEEDMRLIAGVLWKRIAKGMPLQVDAPFMYILNKTSAQLTRDDLALDSPYNTYKYKGLPPAPIGNPGAAAIDTAFYPAASPYLFYLHDAEGGVHFAKTFSEHVQNKKKYLK
jgi:UPF0755 protein